MKFKHVIGIDIAKETFVLSVHEHPFTQEIENIPKAIRRMLKILVKELKCPIEYCLFCFEHTGLYSAHMMEEFEKQQLSFVVVSGLEIKKSLGITRGKSDWIDADKIAEYAYMRQSKLKLYKLPNESLIKLEYLLSLRAMHVRHCASYESRVKEQFRVLKKTKQPLLYNSQQKLIRKFNKEIELVELEIQALIEKDPELKKNYDLLTSIVGIGPVLALNLIVKTRCFTAFSDWRKFACYCGTAPFPNESGKMRKDGKISKIGDHNMKTLLTLAARNAIQYDPEIKLFYKRKIKQGKLSKKVINAVRNKLLARAFSVVMRGTPYVKMLKYAS